MLYPCLDLAASNCAELTLPECWIGVQSEVALDLIRRAGPVLLHLAPLLGIRLKEDSPTIWIHIAAVGEVGSDDIQEVICIHLAFELPGLLRSAGLFTPPRSVAAVGALVDACHGVLLRTGDPPRGPHLVLKKSSGPQKVLSIEDYCSRFRTLPDTYGQDV